MNCPHCDANLPDDAQSCPWCGATLASGPSLVSEPAPVERSATPAPPFAAETLSAPPPPSYSERKSSPPAAGKPKGRSIFMIGGIALIALCCLAAVVVGGLMLMDIGDSNEAGPAPALPADDRPAPGGQPAQGADLVPVQIVNMVEDTICYVAISPTTSDEWGDDLLGEDVFVYPGETVTIYVRPMAHADVGFFDCDENVLGELYDVKVPPNTGMFTLESGE